MGLTEIVGEGRCSKHEQVKNKTKTSCINVSTILFVIFKRICIDMYYIHTTEGSAGIVGFQTFAITDFLIE